MTRACPQRSCWYGGNLTDGVCICTAGYYGVCCDIAAKDTDTSTYTDTDTDTDKSLSKILIGVVVMVGFVVVVAVIVVIACKFCFRR